MIINDIEGKTYGSLVVIGRATEAIRKDAWWVCECVCKNIIVTSYSHLHSGHTSSCGCMNARRLEGDQKAQYKHGMRQSKEYQIWTNMKTRCYNPRSSRWEHYGARGISVCERWQDFENFYEDMGNRPSPEHSIDRIDVNGNYEPSNVRWATRSEQMKNRRPFKRKIKA
jgi:hypothetical protein